MTTVTIRRNPNGEIQEFTVCGHTGYADAGEDILCAALSSVVFTICNGLEQVLSLPIQVSEKDGYVNCVLPDLSEAERTQANILLSSMDLFLDNLIRQYGDYISKTEV